MPLDFYVIKHLSIAALFGVFIVGILFTSGYTWDFFAITGLIASAINLSHHFMSFLRSRRRQKKLENWK